MTLMSRLQTVCLIMLFSVGCVAHGTAIAAQEEVKVDNYQIDGVVWQQADGGWLLKVQGNTKPTYTMYELFSPHRVIIDIANGVLPEKSDLPLEMKRGPVTLVQGSLLTDQDPHVVRFELYLAADSPYSVDSNEKDILVKFTGKDNEKSDLKKEEAGVSITDISINDDGDVTRILLKTSGAINGFEAVELAKQDNQPAKLVVDLLTVSCQNQVVPAPENSPITLVRTENSTRGSRVTIDSALDQLFQYSFDAQSDGLLVTVKTAETDPVPIIADMTGVTRSEVTGIEPDAVVELTPLERAAAAPEIQQAVDVPQPVVDADLNVDDFSFAGYTKQKISVDFFKIDLHNVFRLIGDVSGRNIVVDEGVSGSLTLTLTDVPWDFVLDVILNLKDLAKEDRFNTIVISQKSEAFSWPEGGIEDSLDIKTEEEAISVTKRLDVPKEKLEARSFIRQAKSLEGSGDYSGALAFYEKAFQAWPDNGDLAKKVANVALVHLGLNAKAAHYGKIASRLLPRDTGVALQTALSLANLEKVKEAQGYFDLAVSDERPSRQALSSYAAFSEQNQSYDMAISLLEKYEELYSTSLETMVSKARILDKTGKTEMANAEYRAILLSGYEVPADLEKYIKARTKMSTK